MFLCFVSLLICSAADTWTDGITRWHRVHIHTDSAGKIGETLRSCGWILGEAGKVYIYLSIFISPLVRIAIHPLKAIVREITVILAQDGEMGVGRMTFELRGERWDKDFWGRDVGR